MQEAIARYPQDRQRSAAMPLLHLWQEHFGFISDDGVNWIAAKLGLQPINILELVTFYPMFRRQPAGKTHIRVCRTLSCAMAGSYELLDEIRRAANIPHYEHHHEPIAVSIDGKYSIEFVECLASCGTAPVAMSNDDFHENVTRKDVGHLLNSTASSATKPKLRPPHPRERRLVFANIDREGWSNDIDCYVR